MKKAPEAFRTISEVSDLLDTPAHVLRFWESKFYQIRPVKRAGGRRYYRPDDVALLAGIRLLLQDRGMTIRGVQKVLQEQGARHVAALAPALPAREGPAHDDETDLDAMAGDDGISDAEIVTDEDHAANDWADIEPVGPAPAQSVPARSEPPQSVPAPSAPIEPAVAAPLPPARTPVADPVVAPASAALPEPPPPPVARPASAAPDDKPAATLPPAPPPSPAETAVQPAEDLAEAESLPTPVRLARLLRDMPRGSLGPRRDRAEMLARRIDALLDRMSESSGAGRW